MTGVQTCALPIYHEEREERKREGEEVVEVVEVVVVIVSFDSLAVSLEPWVCL